MTQSRIDSPKRKALVVGLGVSGVAAVRFLQQQGWAVAVSDQRSSSELIEVLQTLAEIEITEGEESVRISRYGSAAKHHANNAGFSGEQTANPR